MSLADGAKVRQTAFVVAGPEIAARARPRHGEPRSGDRVRRTQRGRRLGEARRARLPRRGPARRHVAEQRDRVMKSCCGPGGRPRDRDRRRGARSRHSQFAHRRSTSTCRRRLKPTCTASARVGRAGRGRALTLEPPRAPADATSKLTGVRRIERGAERRRPAARDGSMGCAKHVENQERGDLKASGPWSSRRRLRARASRDGGRQAAARELGPGSVRSSWPCRHMPSAKRHGEPRPSRGAPPRVRRAPPRGEEPGSRSREAGHGWRAPVHRRRTRMGIRPQGHRRRDHGRGQIPRLRRRPRSRSPSASRCRDPRARISRRWWRRAAGSVKGPK